MTLIEQAENFIRDRRITDPILDNLAQLLADFHRELSEWVRVSERLPEETVHYWAAIYYGGEAYDYRKCLFERDSDGTYWDVNSFGKVVAWMPIPPFSPTETGEPS